MLIWDKVTHVTSLPVCVHAWLPVLLSWHYDFEKFRSLLLVSHSVGDSRNGSRLSVIFLSNHLVCKMSDNGDNFPEPNIL